VSGIIGAESVRVDGAVTEPYGTEKAVEQTFYFCPEASCLKKAPKWCIM